MGIYPSIIGGGGEGGGLRYGKALVNWKWVINIKTEGWGEKNKWVCGYARLSTSFHISSDVKMSCQGVYTVLHLIKDFKWILDWALQF